MRTAGAAAALLLALACSPGVEPAPAPTTTPPTTASASRPPVGGIAYVTDDAVVWRDPTGATHDLDDGAGVRALAWNGEYVAWLTETRLYVHDTRRDRTSYTAAISADDTLGVTSSGFVVTRANRVMSFTDVGAVFQRNEHVDRDITGVAGPVRLVATEEPRIVVVAGENPQRFYELDLQARATRRFADDTQAVQGVRHLDIGAADVTTDGRLVYSSAIRGEDDCTLDFELVTRDLATGKKGPPGPTLKDNFFAADSVTTGPDGRTYAAMTNAIGGCPPDREVHRLYVLDRNAWRLVDGDARWGAGGLDGTLAVIRANDDLVVGGAVVAHGVRLAAWSNARG